MYLRANAVSLYFPAKGMPPDMPGGGASAHRHLGGSAVTREGGTWVRALDNVSVSLGSGDRLGLVGHNGSGKSTLLRTLAGLYLPQSGSVERDGPVSGIFNMSIGFRMEASGYRNIVLKGLMAGRSRREIEATVPAITEFTELGAYLHAPMHTYSQGMALRLAFAITTTFNHKIMVMDEWIGAGDARFQSRVINRMSSLLESAHILVLASHNNSLMRKLTDRCIWLEEGRVHMEGETGEVIDRYEEATLAARKAAPNDDAPPRLPIPADYPIMRIDPPHDPGSSAVEVIWDLERFNVGKVRLIVYDPHRDQEQLVCTSTSRGRRRTGEWVKPGMEFRLYEEADGALLASVAVHSGNLVAAGAAVQD